MLSRFLLHVRILAIVSISVQTNLCTSQVSCVSISVAVGGPRHPKLDPVFWCVCLCNCKAAPGKSDIVVGVPDNHHTGGPALWGCGMAGLRCHIPSTRCQCGNGDGLVQAERFVVCFTSWLSRMAGARLVSTVWKRITWRPSVPLPRA